ncbi:MAG: hypothetical protein QOC72_2573 [Methylobacteriaceae bacterium]|jgi:hypothetical protein|nr:hypothetical protein [Methylobacteriaceae bacterium]
MDTIGSSEPTNLHRRSLLGAAGMTLAAAQFSMIGAAAAQSATNASFGPLKQIDAAF